MAQVITLRTLCSWQDMQTKPGDAQDWFLSPETTELYVVQREGAATVIIPLVSVVYPRPPSSTCLHSEEYIRRSGPKYIGSTYHWAPTSYKKQSACPSPLCSLAHPSSLFWHFPSSSTLCLFVFTDGSRQTEKERGNRRAPSALSQKLISATSLLGMNIHANWVFIDFAQSVVIYIGVEPQCSSQFPRTQDNIYELFDLYNQPFKT